MQYRLVAALALALTISTGASAQLMIQRIDLDRDTAATVDGNAMIVAAPNEDEASSVIFFEMDGGKWVETVRFAESADSWHADAVAIAGDWAFASDPLYPGSCQTAGDDDCATGRVRVYHRSNGAWRALEDILIDPSVGGVAHDARFGSEIATNGDWLLISAPNWMQNDWGPTKGIVLFYKRDGTSWEYHSRVLGRDYHLQAPLTMSGGVATVPAPDGR